MERSVIGRIRLENLPMIPVCCICQRIRTLDNKWERQDMECKKEDRHNITHAFCPQCVKLHYPLVSDDAPGRKPI